MGLHQRIVVTIGLFVAVGIMVAGSLFGQVGSAQAPDSEVVVRSSTPFRQMPYINHAVVHDQTAIIYWPKEILRQVSITAIDLQTLRVLWIQSVGQRDCESLYLIGDLVYCRADSE